MNTIEGYKSPMAELAKHNEIVPVGIFTKIITRLSTPSGWFNKEKRFEALANEVISHVKNKEETVGKKLGHIWRLDGEEVDKLVEKLKSGVENNIIYLQFIFSHLPNKSEDEVYKKTMDNVRKIQFQIGKFYEDKIDSKDNTNGRYNLEQAEKWYTEAEKSGHKEAKNALLGLANLQFEMGMSYEKQVKTAEEKGKKYKLAELDKKALNDLYVQHDLLRDAISWCAKAANSGHKQASEALSKQYKKFKELYMRVEDIQNDFAKAALLDERFTKKYDIDEDHAFFETTKLVADAGDGEACKDLAICYENGIECNSSKEAADEYLKQHQFQIGKFYADKAASLEGDLKLKYLLEAFNWLAPAAPSGNNVADEYWKQTQFQIGKVCADKADSLKEDFENALRNRKAAIDWYAAAAASGYKEANKALSEQYSKFKREYKAGIEEISEEALNQDIFDVSSLDSRYQEAGMKLYFDTTKLAAELGVAQACRDLASCYENGVGCQKSDKDALTYFVKAADLHDRVSQIKVAEHYYDAKSRDILNAVKYYKLAADNGNNYAKYMLACIYFKGEDKTPRNRNESIKESIKYAELVANDSSASKNLKTDALNLIAQCYEEGVDGVQNLGLAFEKYKAAADLGLASAQLLLARCYEEGRVVAKNLELAFKNYKAAADTGLASAQFRVAQYYENGEGVVQKNPQAAFAYYEKAAQQDHGAANYTLFQYYFLGKAPAQIDLEKATEYLLQAGNGGVRKAEYLLGTFFENGFYVNKVCVFGKKPQEAVERYKSASSMGVILATCKLIDVYRDGIMGVEKDGSDTVGPNAEEESKYKARYVKQKDMPTRDIDTSEIDAARKFYESLTS